ncbi:MAG: VTT domain-containing protein [Rikenellaceae bacterium]
MSFLRKLYNWVLSWAESKWGIYMLFFIAFAESSFFPIPPDILLIALCLGVTSTANCSKKIFTYAAICTLGSVVGAAFGYTIGSYMWQTASGEFTAVANLFFKIPGFTIDAYHSISNSYNQYNEWITFTAGFTPIPFKIFTIAAGVCNANFVTFILACVVSRGMRFFIIAALIWKFGAPIKSFIDKYFNLLAIAFTVLLIGSFVIIKYVI